MSSKKYFYELRCGALIKGTYRSIYCKFPAGEGTSHPGYGHCKRHSKRREDRAWEVAMDISLEQDISPWEALLWGVRVSAGKLAWIELQLADAIRQNDGGSLTLEIRTLLKESRLTTNVMTRTSKTAIDAGIAAHVARQLETEGKLLATALSAALDALPGLTADERISAISAAQQSLFSTTISGEIEST